MNENDALKLIMNSALKAALPNSKFKNLPLKPKGKLLVIGAGKAAASMAKAFEESYDGPLEGLVITRYGHSTKTKFIEVIEAQTRNCDGASAGCIGKATPFFSEQRLTKKFAWLKQSEFNLIMRQPYFA